MSDDQFVLDIRVPDCCRNCGATSGQWCTWASTLQDTQLGGKQVPADAGDEVTMHCEFSSTPGTPRLRC